MFKAITNLLSVNNGMDVLRNNFTSLHRGETFDSLLQFFLFHFLTPVKFFSHDIDDFREDDFLSGLLINEGDWDAAADYIVWLDGHLALHRVEHLSLNEGIVRMETPHLLPNFTDLNNAETCRAVLPDQVLSYISR